MSCWSKHRTVLINFWELASRANPSSHAPALHVFMLYLVKQPGPAQAAHGCPELVKQILLTDEGMGVTKLCSTVVSTNAI
jgi:hypothetical protein